MKHQESPNRRQRLALAAAAAVAALAVVSAALVPFAVDGRAPYVGNDPASLAAAKRCLDLPARAERRACLRDVAARDVAAALLIAQAGR